MQHPRSHLLLVLLVVTPLALLTWLGTYLIRDAARSTDSAMQAVLSERLSVADHQLGDDLRRLTDQFDKMAPLNAAALLTAQALGEHPWITETWVASAEDVVSSVIDKGTQELSPDAQATMRVQALRRVIGVRRTDFAEVGAAFVLLDQGKEVDRSRQARWQTFGKAAGYSVRGLLRRDEEQSIVSGWHVTDGDFIYWRLNPTRDLVCARLDGKELRTALFARLPLPSLEPYPGRLMLNTDTGIPLLTTGRQLAGSSGAAEAQRTCSAPFTQWVLSYSPAATEFPKPYLFPILLGVSSGCLLVLALAWTFFRENAREIRLAQQRVSFVNQISHELKTPLTNIQLYTEMAAGRIADSGDVIAQRHLGVVETETARLNRLIQNVLNYARQQRDKLTITRNSIKLDEVVSRAVGNWRTLLENKGFHVHLVLEGPKNLQADADALEQILGNLLSNVDKYAAHGRWVSIRTESSEGSARIIVEDRGPGIPMAKRRAVFEPFERLRSDVNEGVSGTGIGLTISRELAGLHGGSLEVCSLYKAGASFILTLPVSKP